MSYVPLLSSLSPPVLTLVSSVKRFFKHGRTSPDVSDFLSTLYIMSPLIFFTTLENSPTQNCQSSCHLVSGIIIGITFTNQRFIIVIEFIVSLDGGQSG
jgi:hypothetical protein